MFERTKERRGVSLLELLAVVTLLGILATVGIMRYGRSIFGNFGSQAASRELSLSLLHAQRGAIATGDNHFLLFDGATATSYGLYQRLTSGPTLIDGPNPLPADVTVTVSHTEMEFTFEGQALAAYSITLAGDGRSWQMDVIPINGSIQVVETTP